MKLNHNYKIFFIGFRSFVTSCLIRYDFFDRKFCFKNVKFITKIKRFLPISGPVFFRRLSWTFTINIHNKIIFHKIRKYDWNCDVCKIWFDNQDNGTQYEYWIIKSGFKFLKKMNSLLEEIRLLICMNNIFASWKKNFILYFSKSVGWYLLLYFYPVAI